MEIQPLDENLVKKNINRIFLMMETLTSAEKTLNVN
jgi:hypothetical protein